MKRILLTALFAAALCMPAYADEAPFRQNDQRAEAIHEKHKDGLKAARKASIEAFKKYVHAALLGPANTERQAALEAYGRRMDAEVAFRKDLKAAGLPADHPFRPRHDRGHDGPPPPPRN